MDILLKSGNMFVYFDEELSLYYNVKEVCRCCSAFNKSVMSHFNDENIITFLFFIEAEQKDYFHFYRICPTFVRPINGKIRLYGVASYDGRLILKPKYNSLLIKGRFLFGQIGPLKGVFSIDMNYFEECNDTYENEVLYRKVLTHCLVDIIGSFYNNVAYFIKDKKIGVLNKNGQICVPCNYKVYDDYNICNLGNLRRGVISFINEKGSYDHYFLSQTGIMKNILNSKYKAFFCLCKNPTFFYAIDVNNIITLFDENFVELTGEYDFVQSVYDTHYLLVRKNNQYGIVKCVPNGIIVIVDCVYQQIFIDRRGIDNERFYLGVKKDDKYGIIDSAGKVVMDFLSLPNDINILPYTFGDGYVGVEKHTIFGRYKVTDVFFMDISNRAKLNLKGQCFNLEIEHIISGFKKRKGRSYSFFY